MIGERQRDEPTTSQATFDAAKNHSVFEGLAGSTGGQSQRLIAVSAVKRIEPTRGVKNRSVGVPADKLAPAGIAQWIELIDSHVPRSALAQDCRVCLPGLEKVTSTEPSLEKGRGFRARSGGIRHKAIQTWHRAIEGQWPTLERPD